MLTFMSLFNQQWPIYTEILSSADKGWCELHSVPCSGGRWDLYSRRRNHPFENPGFRSFAGPDGLPGDAFEAPDAGNIALPGSVRARGECRDVPPATRAWNRGDRISAAYDPDGRGSRRFFPQRDAGSLGRKAGIA